MSLKGKSKSMTPTWVANGLAARSGMVPRKKVPIVAAVPLTEEVHPLRVRLMPVPAFKLTAISARARDHLAPGSAVFSDVLACFGDVTQLDAVIPPS